MLTERRLPLAVPAEKGDHSIGASAKGHHRSTKLQKARQPCRRQPCRSIETADRQKKSFASLLSVGHVLHATVIMI